MPEALDGQRPIAIARRNLDPIPIALLGSPSRGREASPEAGDASSGPGGGGGDKEASPGSAGYA